MSPYPPSPPISGCAGADFEPETIAITMIPNIATSHQLSSHPALITTKSTMETRMNARIVVHSLDVRILIIRIPSAMKGSFSWIASIISIVVSKKLNVSILCSPQLVHAKRIDLRNEFFSECLEQEKRKQEPEEEF